MQIEVQALLYTWQRSINNIHVKIARLGFTVTDFADHEENTLQLERHSVERIPSPRPLMPQNCYR